jgi:hypothetical protein
MLLAAKTKFVLPSDYLGKATVVAVSIVMLLILLNIDKDAIYFNAIYFLSILLIIVSFSNYAVKAIRLKRKN